MIMSLPLIFLIMTAGVDGQQYWTVNYGPSNICALKGSTVKISCVLNYTHDHELRTTFWSKTAVTDGETSNLCLDPENRGGIECDREYKDTRSIILTSVREADKHIYYCRFTNIEGGKWTGIPGAQLDVTDLQVETQQSVNLGGSVTLTCKSSCSLPQQTTFIWYRNMERLTTGTMKVNQLQSVKRTDAGNYQCAVSGYEHLISPPVYLKVQLDDSLQDWGVNYSTLYVCALKGSTVKMSCTVKYPHGQQVETAFWTKPAVGVLETPDLCSGSEKKGRVQCDSEYKDTYRITLMNVIEADKHIYNCRFTTNRAGGKWTGTPGAQLDVTDLQVETQQSVKEGDSITLTCKSSCSLSEKTTFIWYRNTEIVTKGIMKVNQLQLQSVSLHDAGNYQCAVTVRINDHLTSPAVYLNVEYPPKSVSVSISPSGEIVEGDPVTLSCSSDSNPTALIFSWFKESQSSAVGSGQSFNISSFNSSHSGRYYCEVQNKYGSQRSASVSVTVKGVQGAALNTVTGIVAGCGGLIFVIVIVIVIIVLKKKRRDSGAEDVRQNQQEDGVGRAEETAPTNDVSVYSQVSANQRDDLYAKIKEQNPKRSGREQTEKDSGDDVEEVQYATVHHFKKKDVNKTEETTEMQHPSDANRSEDVIYSSVK